MTHVKAEKYHSLSPVNCKQRDGRDSDTAKAWGPMNKDLNRTSPGCI